MSTLLGIVGFSSSGKSTSLRNMPHEETFIISPSKGDLPIPGFKTKYKLSKNGAKEGNFHMTNKLAAIPKIIGAIDKLRPEIKYVVIEDFTHYFNTVTLSTKFREDPDGWGRWEGFGAQVFQAIFDKIKYREDLMLIIMFHPEQQMTPAGPELKILSPGTLLERAVQIPSYFTNLLYTKVIPVDRTDPQPPGERYKFVTNDDGYHKAKTVMGAFDDLYIENDLYKVIKRLNELSQEG
jgi:hypothetical protein